MAIASLVLGIIGLIMVIFSGSLGWLGCILSIVGIVLGVLGSKSDPKNKGMATAGMIMSIIALVLNALFWIACMACTCGVTNALRSM